MGRAGQAASHFRVAGRQSQLASNKLAQCDRLLGCSIKPLLIKILFFNIVLGLAGLCPRNEDVRHAPKLKRPSRQCGRGRLVSTNWNAGVDVSTAQLKAAALHTWSESVPATGILAGTYLRTRGLTCTIPSSIRFHPYLKHRSGQCFPAMVALVTSGTNHDPVWHSTDLLISGWEREGARHTGEDDAWPLLR
jgi:hypothetical protein